VASNGRTISGSAAPSNIEVLMVAYVPLIGAAAFRAAVTSFYGGSVAV
jgi:hypothetical protein